LVSCFIWAMTIFMRGSGAGVTIAVLRKLRAEARAFR
jgi:hypothetical protein